MAERRVMACWRRMASGPENRMPDGEWEMKESMLEPHCDVEICVFDGALDCLLCEILELGLVEL